MYFNFLWVFSLFVSFTVFGSSGKVPFALIYKILPENPIILEAGAHLGEDLAWKSELWPKSKIYAFEPIPESYESVKKASVYSNIQTFPLALADFVGESKMYVAGGASSLLKPQEHFNRDYFFADLDNPITVQCTTIDAWASGLGLDHIDFLWFDLEGYELRALQASPEIFKTIKLIYTEVNLQQFWEGSAMYDEYKAWMENMGFTEIWREIIPNWQGNVLFIKNDL